MAAEFKDWLAVQMELAGFTSQSQLATYLQTTPSVVNAWFTRGTRPNPRMCYRIASVLRLPPEDVLRAAGHLQSEESARQDTESLPDWLVPLLPALKSLDHEEAETVEVTIQTLLERRRRKEERSAQGPGGRGSGRAREPGPRGREPR